MTASPVRALPRAALPDDRSLVDAAAAGDRAAFTQLFRRHVDRVRTHLTRLIGPSPERDDLVQQIFLRLHGALPTYRGECALTTFLHRITVNAAFDHLRAVKRRVEAVDLAGVDALVAPDLDGQARVDARDELVRMFEHLGALNPKKRIAFVLVAIEGMTLAEAADLVGANEDAVKQRVLHARRELATRMARDHRLGGEHE